jgi:hypothetical protein
MAQPSKNRRNLAVIGAGVGVAAAAVVTLLVVRDKPEDTATELSARAAALPSLPNQPLEGGAVKPWEAKQPTPQELAELKRAEEAERDEAKAEEARAEEALKVAETKSARQQALDQARLYGIIGSAAIQQGGAFASLTGTGDISSGFDDTNIYGGLIGSNPTGTGYGPGGGGTGWGTIGTGRYGTIGRGTGGSGYGVGNGRGGMRGRVAAGPTITVGQPSVKPAVAGGDGELDKAIVRRYIKRNIQKLQYCYEKELLVKAGLSGTVATSFTITEAGVVGSASGSGVDATVASCMANVIKGIEFPKPKGTGGVAVSYPFTVRPAAP